MRSRRLNCAAISSRRFFAAAAISLYLVRETLWPKTLKYMEFPPSEPRLARFARPLPFTVNSAVPCNDLVKRGLLHVLAAPRAASEVEGSSLLVDHPRNRRTMVANDHHDGVCAGLIKRAIAVAEHHGTVHWTNGAGGGMSGKSCRSIAAGDTSGGIEDQRLIRDYPPDGIHIAWHEARRVDHAGDPVVVAHELGRADGARTGGNGLNRSEIVVGCIWVLRPQQSRNCKRQADRQNYSRNIPVGNGH